MSFDFFFFQFKYFEILTIDPSFYFFNASFFVGGGGVSPDLVMKNSEKLIFAAPNFP